MFKSALVAAALIGGLFAAAPASAMPVSTDLGTEVGSGVVQAAWYCNPRGDCVQTRRSGYVYRSVPPVRYRSYVAPRRTTVIRRNVGPNRTVTTRRTTRPNGNTVVRRNVVRHN